MPKEKDPQLFSSGYERNPQDRYWTHPWMVDALVDTLETELVWVTNTCEIPGPIWEPAAGRGDMAKALSARTGQPVFSSDIDLSEFEFEGPSCDGDFLTMMVLPQVNGKSCSSIVTNPPYGTPKGIADQFIEHGLSFIEQGHVKFMAMLLRSEFRSGKSKRRRYKFGECPFYLGEIVLTTRPRWDYDDPDAPEDAAPRHNFSWFLWSRKARKQYDHSIQLFHYTPRGFRP